MAELIFLKIGNPEGGKTICEFTLNWYIRAALPKNSDTLSVNSAIHISPCQKSAIAKRPLQEETDPWAKGIMRGKQRQLDEIFSSSVSQEELSSAAKWLNGICDQAHCRAHSFLITQHCISYSRARERDEGPYPASITIHLAIRPKLDTIFMPGRETC